MLILQNITYIHPNGDVLFSDINLTVNSAQKTALIGNNGTGKSTMLRIMAGVIMPSAGQIRAPTSPYYVPQIFGQFNHLTVAQALGVDRKLQALREILNGNADEEHFNKLNDDWTIEERCRVSLHHWQLADLDLSQKMETLSGGQKTKVFLAGIGIHLPETILLDEPSNHLDLSAKQLLYQFIQSSRSTLVVVSHDRKLLNLLSPVYEMSRYGIKMYGGNYDFYQSQKDIERDALSQDIHNKEKELRKAKEKERETLEKQQKLDNRGKGKQENAGVARIMMNTLRNNAERSTSKIKTSHAEKTGGISKELQKLRASLPEIDKMKFGLDKSNLHKGKLLFNAAEINFKHDADFIWRKNLTLQVVSGERIALKGPNGSGKTTLINLVLGSLHPVQGTVIRADSKAVYIDQDYSLIDNTQTVYEQAQKFNTSALQEHEIKIRLNRFLFTKDDWRKPCFALSGGERMRLALCCIVIDSKSPDLVILDEPTNNLDLQNIGILTDAVNEYQGTLIVVSHDEYFLNQISITRVINIYNLHS